MAGDWRLLVSYLSNFASGASHHLSFLLVSVSAQFPLTDTTLRQKKKRGVKGGRAQPSLMEEATGSKLSSSCGSRFAAPPLCTALCLRLAEKGGSRLTENNGGGV